MKLHTKVPSPYSVFSIQYSAFSIQHSAFSIIHSTFYILHSTLKNTIFPLKIFLSSIKKSPKTLRTENREDTPPLTRARHRSRSVSIFSSTSLNAQTGIHSRTKPQPVCKNGDGAATKIMTLQCAVYIVRSKGDRGDIIREVPIGDTVMEDEPYG